MRECGVRGREREVQMGCVIDIRNNNIVTCMYSCTREKSLCCLTFYTDCMWYALFRGVPCAMAVLDSYPVRLNSVLLLSHHVVLDKSIL